MPFKFMTKPLMALMLTAFLISPAFAEKPVDAKDAPAIAKEKGDMGKRRGFIPMEEGDLDKIEKMSPEERDAFFKQKREAFKNLSPEDRKEMRDKRKAWFDGLPEEKKEAIRARHEKMRDEWKARKKAEFDKMTPEEQAKVKARHKEMKEKRGEHHGKFGKHGKGPGAAGDDDADDKGAE